MIDLDFVRENSQKIAEISKQKGVDIDIDAFLLIDTKRREHIQKTENLRQKRNEHAASMKGGKPTPEAIAIGKDIKDQLSGLESELEPLLAEHKSLWRKIPNIPSEDTPVGNSEEQNKVLRTVGEVPTFDFDPKDHMQLAAELDLIDQDRAVRISGARFAYLKGDLVRLQFALQSYFSEQLGKESVIAEVAKKAGLNVSTKPFTLVLPPTMMRSEAYEATGRLKPDDVTFKLGNDDLWLIGSAEHSLCSMYWGETLSEADLPIRYLGYSTSYRREVGSYGKDTAGILRMHHFDKLEMESFSTAAQSEDEHLLMIALQEYIMQELELPYQVVLKCTADMGGPNARGVDIETWLPGQNEYRETHSADWMTDYQARGLQTKVAHSDGSTTFAHTNDATAFAAGRILIAILENYQQADGTIRVPAVLQAYLKKEVIG